MIEEYLGEIIIGTGVGISTTLIGLVIGFFKSIKSLKAKVAELEIKIQANANHDEELKEWVDELIKQKMK